MTVQWLLVAVVAAIAAAYLARKTWRSWAGGCGKGCGCAAPPSRQAGLIAAEELTSRVKVRRTP
jgi:hypothetical protein